jgi:hypothetical protein
MSSKKDIIQYEDRVVCFLDILGFRECVRQTIADDPSMVIQRVGDIEGALETVRDVLGLDKEERDASAQITQFSDSIIISFLAGEQGGVFATLQSILWVLIELVRGGFTCRGGIVRGRLVHNDRLLFGPAMIDAYELEKKVAYYPRVVLDKSIVSLSGEHPAPHHNGSDEITYVGELVVKDFDGIYYLDYFGAAEKELNDPEVDYPLYLDDISKLIEKGLSYKNAGIRIKYQWMKEKYLEIGRRLT